MPASFSAESKALLNQTGWQQAVKCSEGISQALGGEAASSQITAVEVNPSSLSLQKRRGGKPLDKGQTPPDSSPFHWEPWLWNFHLVNPQSEGK